MGALHSTISALSFSVVLTSDVAAKRFVTAAATQAGDGEAAIGVSQYAETAGRAVSVDAVCVVDMVAGAAIPQGVHVQSDANGLPIARTAGVINGLALTAAVNPGDIVKILIK
ncbi:capsid cement protein [Epibacterium ulvae]|uniref:capsid cement protein n=1 Tax=Epibacterium ulvae TaxID=1156985 RepID=UPI002491B394|nr:capsid cement protein [Epibacterium ulvae]